MTARKVRGAERGRPIDPTASPNRRDERRLAIWASGPSHERPLQRDDGQVIQFPHPHTVRARKDDDPLSPAAGTVRSEELPQEGPKPNWLEVLVSARGEAFLPFAEPRSRIVPLMSCQSHECHRKPGGPPQIPGSLSSASPVSVHSIRQRIPGFLSAQVSDGLHP